MQSKRATFVGMFAYGLKNGDAPFGALGDPFVLCSSALPRAKPMRALRPVRPRSYNLWVPYPHPSAVIAPVMR